MEGGRDVTERKREEADRLAFVERRKENLIREVHHRIKNNLQGVIGLLNQRAMDYTQSAEPIREAITQVGTVAAIYGLQSRDKEHGTDLLAMLSSIVGFVESIMSTPIERLFNVETEKTPLVERIESVAVALVIYELLVNASKHRAERESDRPVRLELDCGSEYASLSISNAGSLSPGFDFAAGTGLGTGLALVRSMLPRQGAQLSITDDDGTVLTRLDLGAPVIVDSAADS